MIKKLIELIDKEDISVSSFFYLYRKHLNLEVLLPVSTLDIFEKGKYIKVTNHRTGDFELRQKAIDIIERVEKGLEVKTKNTTKNISKEIGTWLQEYRDLFKGLKPGSMGDKGACMNKMVKFFVEYPEFADKDIIMKATKKYINTEAMNNYKFIQKAHYFIYKQVGGKDNEISNLASFCEEVGEIEEEGFTKML